MRAPLWIIGFRGAGKTTVGRALGMPFLDLDEEWERRKGVSILEFVERQGIEAFRLEEEKLLREIVQKNEPLVIALGGGFVDWEPSRRVLEGASGKKVWLEAPAEVLWRRLEGQPDRRKIGHLNTFPELVALLEKRRPFYEKIATNRVDCQDISECLAALKSLVENG